MDEGLTQETTMNHQEAEMQWKVAQSQKGRRNDQTIEEEKNDEEEEEENDRTRAKKNFERLILI